MFTVKRVDGKWYPMEDTEGVYNFLWGQKQYYLQRNEEVPQWIIDGLAAIDNGAQVETAKEKAA